MEAEQLFLKKRAPRDKVIEMSLFGLNKNEMRLRRIKIFFLLAPALCLLPLPLHAETQILKGTHSTVYEIYSPKKIVVPPDIKTKTYTQEVLQAGKNKMTLRVTSTLKPLNSKSAFPVDVKKLPADILPYLAQTKRIQKQNAQIKSIAEKQTSGANLQWDAAAKILSWLKDYLKYDQTLQFPVDAVSTLKNKTSRCEGFTNLGVALLRAANIPSRAVTYYTTPGHGWGVVPGEGGMHSALEVYYPDAGWIAYDPQGTLHYVDPYHVYLYSEVDDEGSQFLYEGTSEKNMKLVKGRQDYKNLYDFFNDGNMSIKTVSDDDDTLAWDSVSSPDNFMYAAPVTDTLTHATLYGKVTASTGAPLSTDKEKTWVYVWSGSQGKGYFVSANGTFSITGLPGGDILVSAKADGYAESEKKQLTLNDKTAMELHFTLSRGGIISGQLVSQNGKKAQDYLVGLTGEGKAADGSFSYTPYNVDSAGNFRMDDLPAGGVTFVVVQRHTGILEYEQPITIEDGKELVLTITLP